ncbi:RING finger protein 145 [Procambarus clarkii]|uniref:RING finger protein 145 n=1 Tax=Procambarus clarkii TaxID=6728 RepID=UPI001E6784CC|nr:RING finger protein 145-like [Procambarus clarkii]
MDYSLRRRIRGFRGWKLKGEQFEAIATVILRVPGYLILDYWYQNDVRNCIPRSLAWADVVSSGFAIFAVIQGVLVLLLPLEQLVSLYMHYLTIAVLAAADTFSNYYIEGEKHLVNQWPDYGTVSFQGFSNMLMLQKSLFDPHNDMETLYLRQQVAAIVFHTLVATFVTFFLDLECNKDKILLLVYLVPVFARLAGFPVLELHLTHNFASCFVIFLTVQYIFLCVPHVFKFLKHIYSTLVEMVELYGPLGVIITLWSRLFVPIQLLIFWLILFITQLYNHYLPSHNTAVAPKPGTALTSPGGALVGVTAAVTGGATAGSASTASIASSAPSEMWYLVIVQSAAEVCYTPLMLAGTCVAVSYASRIILSITRTYTAGPGAAPLPDDLVHSGWTEGVTMALLAVQTSLLNMAMPERLAVLSIILLIVVSSLVQSMYEIVEPVVLALSAQGVASISRHARAVSACLLLLLLPLYMVYMFTLIFEQDFWLLLVVSTSIMTSVQVLGLLATYVLLTWDAVCAQPWPGLDDLVYYTRATTRVFEFIVAVFVVGAGVKESITGQWSWINAVVLLIHCYFNVWQRLQQGWKSFLLRLEAAKKISALPEASQEQLQAHNDVCAICYAEMTSARTTHCNHLFHGPCLRKWLYVQDKCPMCHAPITLKDTDYPENAEQDATDAHPPPPESIETELGANIPLPDGENEDLSLLNTDEEDGEELQDGYALHEPMIGIEAGEAHVSHILE